MGVSKTPLAAFKRLAALASVALVALAPAVPCGAEIFTLVQPDGSLLITDQPLLPPATPGLGLVNEHPIDAIARRHGMDPLLVRAVIRVESNFDPNARSPKNAFGLMQLIPETSARFNVKKPFDPVQNVRGGLAYLRWLLAYFKGNVALVAAAYNAGERAVEKYHGIPPYAETRDYVQKVLSNVQVYRARLGTNNGSIREDLLRARRPVTPTEAP